MIIIFDIGMGIANVLYISYCYFILLPYWHFWVHAFMESLCFVFASCLWTNAMYFLGFKVWNAETWWNWILKTRSQLFLCHVWGNAIYLWDFKVWNAKITFSWWNQILKTRLYSHYLTALYDLMPLLNILSF